MTYRYINALHIIVSILVLMDAALRHLFSEDVFDPSASFNPCFDGCRPATIAALASIYTIL